MDNDMSPTRSGGHSARFVEVRWSLASKRAEITPFVDQLIAFIRSFIRKHGFTDGTEEDIETAVRDEGRGFDPGVLPDPTDRNNLLLSHGRGIYLIRTVMDEVSFEEHGSVVCMRKKLTGPSHPANRAQSLPN